MPETVINWIIIAVPLKLTAGRIRSQSTSYHIHMIYAELITGTVPAGAYLVRRCLLSVRPQKSIRYKRPAIFHHQWLSVTVFLYLLLFLTGFFF